MPIITEFEPQESTLLLDSEGALTLEFESILLSIFLKYASNSPTKISLEPIKISTNNNNNTNTTTTTTTINTNSTSFDIFSNLKTLSRKDLNQFSLDTNGIPMTDETFNEISEYLDMLEQDEEEEEVLEGMERLTFKGFLQLYQLQTESDEEETWRDLTKWGYSKELKEFTLIQGSEIKSDSDSDSSVVVNIVVKEEKVIIEEKKVEDLLKVLSVED